MQRQMYYIARHCRPPSLLTQGYTRFAMVIDKVCTSTHSRLRGASTCFLISFTTITFFNASGFVEATSCSKQKVMVALLLKKWGCFFVKLVSLKSFEGTIYRVVFMTGPPQKCQTLRKFWHLGLFRGLLWFIMGFIMQSNTFKGGPAKKNTLYIMLIIIRLPTKARCAMAPKVW